MNGVFRGPIGIALAVGGLALLLSMFRLAAAPDAFFRSYLPACLFWGAIPVGSLAWLMIHRLTGGGWGVFAHRTLAAGAAVLPVNVVLFLPLAFGLGHLYRWAGPDGAAVLTGGKAVWLRPGFFLFREAVVLASWLGLAWISGVWANWRAEPRTKEKDEPAEPGELGAALGLIVFGIGVTLFAIDWVMSLEPRWTSGNIGFLAAVGPMLLALAFAIGSLCRQLPDSAAPHAAGCFGDLGSLLLAFVLLWSYLAFQQYLTIWSENLPEKAIWYVQRNQGGWRGWSWILASVAGAIPFFLLLSRKLKRDSRRLIWAAGCVLAGGLLDAGWQVLPAFYGSPGQLSVLDLLPVVGIGGLWIGAYLWVLPRYLKGS